MTLLKRNTISSVLLQIVRIICGFILPRFILEAFGSDTNGLISSIAQFLQLFNFLDLGVSAVIQSALYRPLAMHNKRELSCVIISANKFYRMLAKALLVYVAFLLVLLPRYLSKDIDNYFVTTLLIVMSFDSFIQYYFGLVNTILISADQHGYINNILSIITIIINTVISVLLIDLNFPIQAVKFTSAFIYLIRPIIIFVYVHHYYEIDYSVKYDKEPIRQKWSGVAQHICAVILDGTDIVILSLFSTLSNISVYSVYNLVVNGIRSISLSAGNGMQPYLGALLATGKLKEAQRVFLRFEWIIHSITTVIFGCTSVLIVSFVSIYTQRIRDINNNEPVFGCLISLAQAFRCIRLPYNITILAAGHYKQTQSNYIIASLINISTSIILVLRLGVVGVAIGTLIAFIYQNIWMALYVSQKILHLSFQHFIKQTFVDSISFTISFLLSQYIDCGASNILDWIIKSVLIFLTWSSVSLIVNLAVYKDNTSLLFRKIFGSIL